MRVTQTMLSNNSLRNLSLSYSKLEKIQEQITTQKKFARPSDDPVAAMKAMGYRTDLNQIQQYSRNIGEVNRWIDSTDNALSNATDALQRIRELMVEANNGSLEESQRSYVATEIEELIGHLSNIGDTQVGGKYIFNGTQTNERPSASNFQNAEGTVELEIFSNIKIQVNTEGKALFGDMLDPTNSYLHQMVNDLNDPDVDLSTLGGYLDNLDSSIDKVITERANVGARQNRVELMEDRLMQQEVFATQILSDNEDIDFEKVVSELISQESVHRAALGVGAKIIQPTLMDFLR